MNAGTCLHCGKVFEPTRVRQICCSLTCTFARKKNREKAYYQERKQARKVAKVAAEPKILPCQLCGTEFTALSAGERYCSEVCRKAANRNRAREYWRKNNAQPHEHVPSALLCPFERGDVEAVPFGGCF